MTTTTTSVRPGSAIGLTAHRHLSQLGFCVVCGGVWPCWRGRRDAFVPSLA